MENNKKAAGIILSAGFSSRMKEFKPLMKIGEKNSLEILTESFKNAGIEDVFVVVGYNADIIRKSLEEIDVEIVYNEKYEEGMFTSIQKGISAAAASGHGTFVVTPVDIPLIPPYIIKAVIEKHKKNEDCFVIPCFESKHGHPLLVPDIYAGEVMSCNGENGMKSVTTAHRDKMFYFETRCEGIIRDMDTQEAYRSLVDYYERNKYPSPEQCRRIYERCATPSHVIRHCMAVTKVALTMARALNEKGYSMSIPLVEAAGMLHDSLRTQKKHWDAAADMLISYGYPEVADIVREHMNYVHPLPVFDVTEKDLLCLADKLCQEDKLVTLDDRMRPVRARWKDDPEALGIITSRISAAGEVMKFISGVIGKEVYDLLNEAIEEEKARHPAPAMRRLFLIRHGETQRHKEKVFMGQTDVPLNADGKEQCTHIGLELQHFGLDTKKVYSSDLKRAVDSSKIIARILGDDFEIVEVPEFRELALGSWDGKYISEIKEQESGRYEERGRDLLGFKIDEEAENFFELRDRVLPAFRKLAETTTGDLIIVAHSGVDRVIKCYLTGRSLSEVTKMGFQRGTYEIIEFSDDTLPAETRI